MKITCGIGWVVTFCFLGLVGACGSSTPSAQTVAVEDPSTELLLQGELNLWQQDQVLISSGVVERLPAGHRWGQMNGIWMVDGRSIQVRQQTELPSEPIEVGDNVRINGISSGNAWVQANKIFKLPPPHDLYADVPASLESFSTATSPHTETLHLQAHAGQLFAGMSQWEQVTNPTGAQVLIKDGPNSEWRPFDTFEALRITAMESFTIPAEFNQGRAVEVLLAEGGIAQDTRTLAWRVGNDSTWTEILSLPATDIERTRSFGMHAEGDTLAFYIGTSPRGILRGIWDAPAQTILWDFASELPTPPTARENNRVAGFADCGGSLYATAGRSLWRRNDGDLPVGTARWVEWYGSQEARGTGLRGLTCIEHHGQPALLVSPEGDGSVLRFDALPQGILSSLPSPQITREIQVQTVITNSLQQQGFNIPASGRGAVDYVIAAYNEFTEVDLNGETVHLFGVEWAYEGNQACPEDRICAPDSDFDGAACFLIRTSTPQYAFRCLSGPDFHLQTDGKRPVDLGEAFVATRTLQPSPWKDGTLFLGGYDANSIPSSETAWIARLQLTDLLP